MNIFGMSPEEKLTFLDRLIDDMDGAAAGIETVFDGFEDMIPIKVTSIRDDFHALYVALGDDLFLAIFMLMGRTVNFPSERQVRLAQANVEKLTRKLVEVPKKSKTGTHKRAVPQKIELMELNRMLTRASRDMETREIVDNEKLVKGKTYAVPDLEQEVLVLTAKKEIFGRRYYVITKIGPADVEDIDF